MKTVLVIGNHSALIHAVSLMNCTNIVVVAADREPDNRLSTHGSGWTQDDFDKCAEAIEEQVFDAVFGDHLAIALVNHEKIKGPVSHLDNQSFIQQKMQGKRRVY